MATNDELQAIPGVGKSLAAKLRTIGIHKVEDLQGKDAEVLYAQLMDHVGTHIDRCVLYVFRCAVYYAENEQHDLQKLKWWNWKDER